MQGDKENVGWGQNPRILPLKQHVSEGDAKIGMVEDSGPNPSQLSSAKLEAGCDRLFKLLLALRSPAEASAGLPARPGAWHYNT